MGPSGSGKSSLVKAGVIPALWRGDLPGSERWFVVEMLPGTHPLDELEVALTRVASNQAGNLNEQLKRDSRGLVRTAGLILPNDGTELVIVIDQFEEVFTLVSDDAERVHFLDLLVAAVTEPRTRVRIIITLRADFYDRPLHYAQFGELVRTRLETIMPLSMEELERAITQPALRAGVTFEPGLVSTIIGDVNYQPGALPLLQYALTELFEARQGRILTRTAYQGLGGTVGALTKRAEEVYLSLADAERELARQIFLRLVTLGEGTEDTRRRVLRSELKALTNDSDRLDEILEIFAVYRLFALDTDVGTRSPTVEIAHEALLREWERLRGWLNDSRDDIKIQRQIALMTDEWRGAAQDAGFLARGARLTQFETWAQTTSLTLNAHERAFLDASLTQRTNEAEIEAAQQARERHLERRSQTFLRGLVLVLTLALIGAFGLTAFAFDRESEAVAARAAALNAQATSEANFTRAEQQRLYLAANEAMNNRATGNIGLALALRSLALGYTPGADAALMRASRQGIVQRDFLMLPNEVSQAIYSSDGEQIAVASGNGMYIYDATTGEELRYLPDESVINTVAFSPDGRQVVTGNQSGMIRLYDAATWRETNGFPTDTQVYVAYFTEDNRRLIIHTEDALQVWDTVYGEMQDSYLRDRSENLYPLALIFGVENRPRFVMREEGRRIYIQDAVTDEILCSLLDTPSAHRIFVYWSETEPVMIVSPIDPVDGLYTAYAWNFETCTEISQFSGHSSSIQAADYDPVRGIVVTGDYSSMAIRWDFSTGREISRYTAIGSGGIRTVDISPDGMHLLVPRLEILSEYDLAFPSQPTFISTDLYDNTYFPRFAPDGE
ncbi:MAG: WD40 repeat domain-containing protein, partial [Anaerolineae bacterium]|nr:WD40 repeat domain-containing protein [Anaerolineae bacterium]